MLCDDRPTICELLASTKIEKKIYIQMLLLKEGKFDHFESHERHDAYTPIYFRPGWILVHTHYDNRCLSI